MIGPRIARLALLVGLPVAAAGGAAADTFSRGSVSVESRVFEPDEVEDTEDVGLALTTRLEIKVRPQPWTFAIRGLARLDAIDDTRNIVALEEAFVGYSAGRLNVNVGSQILNWTATEAFHPSDIINSRNFDSDLENLEKLGEPMVEVQLQVLQGALSLYYMPLRISPNLVPASSRLSLVPLGIELGDTLWVSRNGKKSEAAFAHQGAVHFSQTVGSADIAVHVVDHSDRHQPTFTFDAETGEVRPTFHSVTQIGLTYVQVFGSLLVKVEAARRSFRSPDPDSAPDVTSIPTHEQVAAGVEYGWITSAGHSATLIAEGQAILEDRETRRALHLFQGDALVGYRHAFNDEKGRELLLVFITDVERPYEYVAGLRYGQRLSDTWSIGGTARSLRLPGKDIVNQAQVTLTRNF